MESGMYWRRLGGLRRWDVVCSRREWTGRISRGNTGRLSRKRPIHSAIATETAKARAISGKSVDLSGNCKRQTLHQRYRNALGLRDKTESLVCIATSLFRSVGVVANLFGRIAVTDR